MTWIFNLLPAIHVGRIFVNKNKDFFRNSDIHKRIDMSP